MRTLFRGRVAGLASALSDNDVDVYLDQTLQYSIPSRVDGMLSDGEWTFPTVASTVSYQLPANVHSPRVPVYVDGDSITTYTRRDQFWVDYDADTTTESKPTAALIYGGGDSSVARHSVRFYPIPDAVYTVTGGARVYPTTSIASISDLDDIHALAVVSGSAQEFALNKSEDEIAQREGIRFQDLLGLLRTRSNSPAERRYRRTF